MPASMPRYQLIGPHKTISPIQNKGLPCGTRSRQRSACHETFTMIALCGARISRAGQKKSMAFQSGGFVEQQRPKLDGSVASRRARRSPLRVVAVALVMVLAAPFVAQAPAMAVTNTAINPSSAYRVGEDFEHNNYGGAYLYVNLPFTCSGIGTDRDFGLGNMPATWSNEVTSYRTFSTCAARHWMGTFFSGANTGLSYGTPNVGATYNDNTESIEWT